MLIEVTQDDITLGQANNPGLTRGTSADLGPGHADMWRATVDIAPWRINALYTWYAEEDDRPVSRAFPQGSLVFFKEGE